MQIDRLKALLGIKDAKVEISKFADVTLLNYKNKLDSEYIEKVENVNIYTNVFLNYKKIVPLAFQKDEIESKYKNKTIILEHTSVNPNKAIHVGHLRNVYIGDFIRRILLFSGAKVKVANFIEDTGSQVADIIIGLKIYNIDQNNKFDLECAKIYKKINERYLTDEKLLKEKKDLLKSIEEDENLLQQVKEIARRVLKGQLETIIPQGVNYDYLTTESYLIKEGLIREAEKLLKENGIIEELKDGKNKGCTVLKKKPNIILRRSDGTALYLLKDITYALWKLKKIREEVKWETFGKNLDGSEILISEERGNPKEIEDFDINITIVDSRQRSEQEEVAETVNSLNKSNEKLYEFLTYEPVAISKKTAKYLGIESEAEFLHMSGRKGIEVFADELINLIKEKLRGENKEKLAYNVIKYSMLKTSPAKMMIFDLDEAINIKGNTGLYVSYTLARAKQVLNKATNIETSLDFDEDEKNLIRQLLFWDEYIKRSLENLDPSILVNYLYSICTEFNKFYEKNRIIGSQKEKERIYLVKLFVYVVENLFDLLGLFKLEKV
ncbi:MAG: arginine--tRNA ligase [Candidatus Parvarchaeota archaeon]|nr:arginine--tRNA ligase [Candidatus Rehaiarchaeum fermentans]